MASALNEPLFVLPANVLFRRESQSMTMATAINSVVDRWEIKALL
jgi:hypothetical protein